MSHLLEVIRPAKVWRKVLQFSKVLLLLSVGLLLTSSRSFGVEVWLSATEPTWRNVRGWPSNDYISLFQEGAPWKRATRTVNVFELSKRFVIEADLQSLDAVLRNIQDRRFLLSVQATPLIASNSCGRGIEGYGPPDDMAKVAAKIQKAGGSLALLRMDEPLWYGHRATAKKGLTACHDDIEHLASQAAMKIATVREIFPGVAVGDIEPLGVPLTLAKGWEEDIAAWLGAYERAVGEPLAFFHTDVVWLQPSWRAVLPSVADLIRRRGIPFGIIYNGTPLDDSDVAWVESAAAHFREVEGQLRITPDQAILQSWMDRPRALLPEDKRGSMTSLVTAYSEWRSAQDRR